MLSRLWRVPVVAWTQRQLLVKIDLERQARWMPEEQERVAEEAVVEVRIWWEG